MRLQEEFSGDVKTVRKTHLNIQKKRRKNMKDKIFGVLQRVGRSFMLPIAVLTVAGLLLGMFLDNVKNGSNLWLTGNSW